MGTIGPASTRRGGRSRRSLATQLQPPDTASPNPRGRSLNRQHDIRGSSQTSRSVVIAEPVRTAIGAFGGTLKDVPAPDLGAVAIRAAVERAGLKPEEVETA